MNLYHFHTPEQVPSAETMPLPDCAVVVDVLRATTTMAAALQAGAEAVQVFADLAELEAASMAWDETQRVRSGERGGERVSGYDLGNSPLDYTAATVAGKRIFLSTTNGTRALARVQQAPTVLTAALVNVDAVARTILAEGFDTVWMVGSGWQGAFSLEDTICAGALAAALLAADGSTGMGNDETVAAIALYQHWQDNLAGLMRLASHGQRLLRLGRDLDLDYCSTLNSLDVVPRQTAPSVLAA